MNTNQFRSILYSTRLKGVLNITGYWEGNMNIV